MSDDNTTKTSKRGRPRKYFTEEELREGRRLCQIARRRKQKELLNKLAASSDEEHSK